MRRIPRIVLTLVGVVALAAVAAVVSSTIFLAGPGLRVRVEETLTRAIGRDVHLGSLDLSLWTGRLVAKQMTVAEAPGFGTEPFVRAERVDMGVELWPLLLRRQVRIHSFVLRSPAIRLVRNAGGVWNDSLLSSQSAAPGARQAAPRSLPDLAISRIAVEDGSVLVLVPTGEMRSRLYHHVNLSVRQFSLSRAFPFQLSADLPGAGHVEVNGSTGPWNRRSVSDTPFFAHFDVRDLDLARSGLAGAESALTGEIAHAALDLAWSEHRFQVSHLKVSSPELTFARGTAETREASPSRRSSVWNDVLDRLSIHAAEVQLARLTVLQPGARPATYRHVVAHVAEWSRNGAVPFTVSVILPGGGNLSARGRLLARTPESAAQALDAHVSVRHLDLESSGYLPAGSAIRGSANLDAQVATSAGGLRVAGTTRLDRLALTKSAQPSAQPVLASFALTQQPEHPGAASLATLEQATVSIGSATAHVTGTFHPGPGAAVHLAVHAEAIPIDQIEAFLPAVGVELPEGSRLSGGVLSTDLSVEGAAPHLVVSGPVRVVNTRLNGFNLGAKLTSLARFTGGRIGAATGPGTTIRSLSLDLHAAEGRVQTSGIVAAIAGVGTATGEGVVGPGDSLQYSVSLKLTELVPGPDGGAGVARQLAQQLPGAWASRVLGAIDYLTTGPMKNGIPLLIGGTTKHPTFEPNLGALIPPERPRR